MEETQSTVKSYKKAPFKQVHFRILLALVLGQIACGYALGIAGIGFSQAQKVMGFSDLWIGLLGAGSLIGLAGSSIMGKIADSIGRRGLLMINMGLFALFSLGQLLTTNVWILFILRILIGLMIAIDYTVGNSLLVEWLPEKEAGKRQSRLIFYWTIGFVCSYICGNLITGFGSHNWQVILASSFIPGIIAAIYRTVYRIPASPSWLASQGEKMRARKVIKKHLGLSWDLPTRMLHKSSYPVEVTWRTPFSREYRRRTLVGGIFYACQAFSFFGISIFLPILLKGMHITDQMLSGTIYNVCVMVGVIIGLFIFGIISRRSFLVGHLLCSSILLLVLSFLVGGQIIWQLGLFATFSVILSAGLVLDYTYPTELFDVKVRATGVGVVITFSRVGAAGGTFLLPLLTSIGGSRLAMLVCAGVLCFGGLVCLFFAPETSPKFK